MAFVVVPFFFGLRLGLGLRFGLRLRLRRPNRSREVEENCEYVGDEFAEEAKRIHYGESEERGIYGEATDEEAEKLDDEKIEYVRFPFTRRRDS